MSNVINNNDIKAKVVGKFGNLFARTNIEIGTTDKFIYKKTSKGKNSETKIYPQARIDSYGIEMSQKFIWLLLATIFTIILPIFIYPNLASLGFKIELIILLIAIGLIFFVTWLFSGRLKFVINSISKEKLSIELKTTNTKDIEDIIQHLNQRISPY